MAIELPDDLIDCRLMAVQCVLFQSHVMYKEPKSDIFIDF